MISSAEFYKLRGSVETIRPLVEKIFDDFIDALMTPLSTEETNPPPSKPETDGLPELLFIGDSYEDAYETFNQSYLGKQWGDGLPMVPPTPERLKWMLSGTQRSPQEVLGKINPKQGNATIEKIAISAVMAGARPEHLPVIIAAMEILTDETFDDLHVLASAGSFGLLIVVSGPLAKELNMNSGIGFLGHGNRANNTIGRAVRLATLNIGRTWPAKNDMALIGRLSPHTFFTFSENADMSPWSPYHASRGFAAAQSCVTVATIYGRGPLQHFYGGMIMTWTADGVLDNMINDLIQTSRRMLGMWGTKGVGAFPGSGGGPHNHMIILFPELAAEYQKVGYDQVKLQNEIYRRVTVPYEDLGPEEVKSIQNGLELGVIPGERKAVFTAALHPGKRVPLLVSPEDLHLFVAGGAPVRLEHDFREIHFGRWEGLSKEEIEGSDPILYRQWQSRTSGFEFPSGERRADFRERVLAGFERVLESGATRALLVVHKGIIRTIAEKVLGRPLEEGSPELGGSVGLSRNPDGTWVRGRRSSNPS